MDASIASALVSGVLSAVSVLIAGGQVGTRWMSEVEKELKLSLFLEDKAVSSREFMTAVLVRQRAYSKALKSAGFSLDEDGTPTPSSSKKWSTAIASFFIGLALFILSAWIPNKRLPTWEEVADASWKAAAAVALVHILLWVFMRWPKTDRNPFYRRRKESIDSWKELSELSEAVFVIKNAASKQTEGEGGNSGKSNQRCENGVDSNG